MSISFDKVFGVHPHALNLRTQRSEVLAANLANADTPGYKAKDFDLQALLKGTTSPRLEVQRTHANHIAPDRNEVDANLLYRVPQQASVDGNTVEAHTEQAQFLDNSLNYQTSLRFINGRISGMMTALRGE